MPEYPDIGWCHHCETFQLLSDAPWLDSPYAPGIVPCCVVCREDEPWCWGVFDVGPDVCPNIRLHAERQDAFYPGYCGCNLEAGRRPAQ